MNVLSLFSGIGGLELGLERAGMTVVGQVELDPWCRRVLAKPVAPVSVSSPWLCAAPGCEAAATWQVGPERRSCTADVGVVLAELYAAEPRPFQPFLPVPLNRGNW